MGSHFDGHVAVADSGNPLSPYLLHPATSLCFWPDLTSRATSKSGRAVSNENNAGQPKRENAFDLFTLFNLFASAETLCVEDWFYAKATVFANYSFHLIDSVTLPLARRISRQGTDH